MIDTKRIVHGLAIFVLLSCVLSLTMPAYAASNGANGGNWFSGLVTFIAQRFGLDKTQVQSAIHDYHTQRQQTVLANMQIREKTRLDNLVKQGKITADQETAIVAELQLLSSTYPFTPNQTKQQRQQNLQNMQNDWKTWAQSQNPAINPSILFTRGMMGRFQGHRYTPTP